MSAHDELFATAAVPNHLAVFGDCGRFVYQPQAGSGETEIPCRAIVHDELIVGQGQEQRRTRAVDVVAAECVGPAGEKPRPKDFFAVDGKRYVIDEVTPGDDGTLAIRGAFVGLWEKTKPGYRGGP